MTLTATIQASIDATSTAQSGLTTAVENHPLAFNVSVGDCSVVWSDRRICSATGVNDVLLASEAGVSVVKFLLIRNLSDGFHTVGSRHRDAPWNGNGLGVEDGHLVAHLVVDGGALLTVAPAVGVPGFALDLSVGTSASRATSETSNISSADWRCTWRAVT